MAPTNPQDPSKPPEISISPLRAICNLPDGDPDDAGTEVEKQGEPGVKLEQPGLGSDNSKRQLVGNGCENVGIGGGRGRGGGGPLDSVKGEEKEEKKAVGRWKSPKL